MPRFTLMVRKYSVELPTSEFPIELPMAPDYTPVGEVQHTYYSLADPLPPTLVPVIEHPPRFRAPGASGPARTHAVHPRA